MDKSHKFGKPLCLLVLTFVLIFALLKILYAFDNKYKIQPPLGQGGILRLSEIDLQSGRPIFLIDGWARYDGRVLPGRTAGKMPIITYIGQHANYAGGNPQNSPLGEATYRLLLDYTGADSIVTVFFPELISEYTLWIDGVQGGSGTGDAAATFLLGAGQTELLVCIKSDVGYYSGMYFPGAISTAETMAAWQQVRTASYLAAFVLSLTLALFSLALWQGRGRKVYRLFGALCLAFCFYISYYFVRLLHMPFEKFWYLVEDTAFYLLVSVMLWLSAVCAKLDSRRAVRAANVLAVLFWAVSMLLFALIAYLPFAAQLHGLIQDVFRVFAFLWLVGISAYALLAQVSEYQHLLVGNMVFGIGLLVNFISANRFEPIYTFWQFEWCGVFLVLIFAQMMVRKNKRILCENAQLTENLERLVELRTQKLALVLEERRHFFSNMAHDLKAPLYATQSFIGMIKAHRVDVDDELATYIAQVEERQSEMQRRVESLNTLTQVDRIQEKPERIEIGAFLRDFYQNLRPEADVLGIYLKQSLPDGQWTVLAQREKLVIAIENLIYNAFGFTPPGGSVTLSAQFDGARVFICVADTGTGIAAEKLPLVFNQFYVGRKDTRQGSGLGLYIVKLIAEELDGAVSVVSEVGNGAAFTIALPVVE